MRWKSSYLIALGIIGATALFLTVLFVANHTGGSGNAAAAGAHPENRGQDIPTVQVALVQQVVRPYSVAIRGHTEAARTVSVRAETAGIVAQTPAREGAFVGRGAVLCRLSIDARRASLDQARAAWRARQLQQQASARLAEQGFRSPTQVLQDQANLDQAGAAVRQAQVSLEQVNIRAPFGGVFDHRDAEIGSYLAPGQPCGTVIELDPMLIVGDLPEMHSADVHMGSEAVARLASGGTIAGHVRFVAHDADPQTRTYRVEIIARNPGAAVRSGLSADVSVAGGSGPAHLLPVSSLVLDALGRQGVRYVTDRNVVAFSPVQILEETPQGVWVSGLSGPIRVITVGQSYVGEGQVVRIGQPGAVAPRTPAPPAASR
jgi:multidrug efflux system membrane fusion protein